MSENRARLLSRMKMAMGGRVAEELVFGPDKVSNGAAGDIKAATNIARTMVTEWGMSDKLGMIAYGDNSQEVFLGHSVTQNKNVSELTARDIDGEIKLFIDNAYSGAKTLLTERLDELHRLARGLLEYETLSGDEIRTVLRGEPVIRKVVDEPAVGLAPRIGADRGSSDPAGAGGWPWPGAAAGLIPTDTTREMAYRVSGGPF